MKNCRGKGAFGFIDGWTAQGVDNTVRAYTGHIEIFRKGYREDLQLNRSIKNIAEVLQEIEKEPTLSRITVFNLLIPMSLSILNHQND